MSRKTADITLSATAFNENISSGTNIASLTATDSDNGDSHTFTLATGNGTNDADNNYFAIQGASLVTSGTFDFETKSSYNVYINTNDGTDNYAKAFTLSVNDVNEAQIFAEILRGLNGQATGEEAAASGEQQPNMGAPEGVPAGANPADPTGVGGGTIGTGTTPTAGESGFTGNVTPITGQGEGGV